MSANGIVYNPQIYVFMGNWKTMFKAVCSNYMYPCSVAQLCSTLCDPMYCSTPAFPLLHHLPELAQTHIHWVGGAIQPSHPLSSCPQSFPVSGFFLMSRHFTSGGQSIGASVLASVLSVYIQDWFPLGWTGWISLLSKGLSKSLLQHHNSKASILLHSALFMVQLTSIYDYWKNHSFDQMDLCLQSNVSAF